MSQMSDSTESAEVPDRATMPLWSVDGEVIRVHYSSLNLHRKCPQAWLYRYEMGLREEPTVSPYRDFGSWWSALRAAESLERGRKLDSLVARPSKMGPVDNWEKFDQRKVMVDDVLESAYRWWKSKSGEEHEEFIEKMGEPLPERLEGAFVRWMDEWKDERKHERPLGVEVFWERDLPRPAEDAKWDHLEGSPRIKMIGFIDELLYREDRGITVVRDNKTHQTLGQRSTADDLMDSQLSLYAWGITPSLRKWGVPPVRAIAYDRTRSVAPTLPKLNKSGTLSKSVTMYDVMTYQNWVGDGIEYEGLKKDGSGAGTYLVDEKVIEALTTPAWRANFHQRTFTPVSKPMIRAHLRAAVDTAMDIYRTRLRFQRTGEGARNFGEHCKWCPFADLCRAQMMGGPEGEYELSQYGLVAKDGRKFL